jgi:protein SCO1/2
MGVRHANHSMRLEHSISVPSFTLCFLLSVSCSDAATAQSTFPVRGTIEQIQPESQRIVIQHDAISNYMDAMTMPFKVKDAAELNGLEKGDVVSFRLQVTSLESWIDQIRKVGTSGKAVAKGAQSSSSANPSDQPPAKQPHPLMEFKFTNELGHPVSLADFHGQALAITFFFTRCPIPDYCPRLSRNFEAASQKLAADPSSPTNWHFLSVTFDPENDTPAVLKSYGELYHYDPSHWSFLTGPSNKVAELAHQSDVTYERDGAFFNHNFRTLIIDTNGHLQMMFPMGGDLSDSIVEEIRKAANPKPPAANTER